MTRRPLCKTPSWQVADERSRRTQPSFSTKASGLTLHKHMLHRVLGIFDHKTETELKQTNQDQPDERFPTNPSKAFIASESTKEAEEMSAPSVCPL